MISQRAQTYIDPACGLVAKRQSACGCLKLIDDL